MVTEDVADLVMPGELAHSLALKILEVFGEIETTED
jgi:hypothetical protein